MTQEQLAQSSGLSRNTINRLESGLFPDLGVKKVDAILHILGMELAIKPARAKPDYAGMASASASVSFRKQLSPEELVHALVTGKVPPGKAAHIITLLEESPPALLKGLIEQVGALSTPMEVRANLRKLAGQVDVPSGTGAWQKRIG